MPPKRKPTTESAAENGVSGDVPRVKLARAAKQAQATTRDAEKPEGPVRKAKGEAKPKKAAPDAKAKEAAAAKPKAKGEDAAAKSKSKVKEAAKPKSKRAPKPKTQKDEEDAEEGEGADEGAGDEELVAKPKRGKRKVEENATEPDQQAKKHKPIAQNKTSTNYENLNFSCTRKNANDNEANMRISSWNVDGLRAWVKKNGLEFITREDPDILCLQETKCSEEKLPNEVTDYQGYNMYWCAGEKEGYAGVALFSKTEPISIKYGLGLDEFDDEGRCITAEYDSFYLVNVYVPNAGRGLVTLPKRLSWNNAFKTYIKELDLKKPVIVCGDMNVAHKEIDLTNPKTNKKNAGFTPEEREGMTQFLDEGFIDSYREFYPDTKDAYTFWSYMSNARAKNVGWRLDYFIVSQHFMDNICDNVIRSEVFGSDHCPITLFLNI